MSRKRPKYVRAQQTSVIIRLSTSLPMSVKGNCSLNFASETKKKHAEDYYSFRFKNTKMKIYLHSTTKQERLLQLLHYIPRVSELKQTTFFPHPFPTHHSIVRTVSQNIFNASSRDSTCFCVRRRSGVKATESFYRNVKGDKFVRV